MEAVHHLKVASQVLFGEVVQHACIHQTLHEVGAVLRQSKAGQPFIPYPLMIHVSIGQSLQGQVCIMLLVFATEKESWFCHFVSLMYKLSIIHI